MRDQTHDGVAYESLMVTADTFAASGASDARIAHGVDARLRVGYYGQEGYDDTIAYLRFDLARLPVGAVVEQATLRVFFKRATYRPGADTVPVELRRVGEGWDAASLTWLNRPTVDGAPLSTADIGLDVDTTKVWDVPASLVNGWLRDPGANFGLALLTTASGNPGRYSRSFLSLEGFQGGDTAPGNHPPELAVKYVVPTPTSPPTSTFTPTPTGALSISIHANVTPGTPVLPGQRIVLGARAINVGGLDLTAFHVCGHVPTAARLLAVTTASPELTRVPTVDAACGSGDNAVQWYAARLERGRQVEVGYRVEIVAPPLPTRTPSPSATVPPSPAPTTPSAPPAVDGLLEDAEVAATVGLASPPIRGLAFVPDRTDRPGPAPDLVAEVGYGPEGSDPSAPGVEGWVFLGAQFFEDHEASDRFAAAIVPPRTAVDRTFDLAYRFSLDGERTWTYADASPASSQYDPAHAGKLRVAPALGWARSQAPGRGEPRSRSGGAARGPGAGGAPAQRRTPTPTATPGILLVACVEGWTDAYVPQIRDRACLILGRGVAHLYLPLVQ